MLVDKTPSYAWSLATLRARRGGLRGSRSISTCCATRTPRSPPSRRPARAGLLPARREPVHPPPARRAELAARRSGTSSSSWPACRRSASGVVRFEDLVAEPERVLRGALRLPRHRLPPRHGRALQGPVGADDRRPPRRVADAGRRQVPPALRGRRAGGRSAGASWRPRTSSASRHAAARRRARLRGRAASARPGPPIARRRRCAGEPLPLSFAQERLWFLDRLDPGTRPTTSPPPCASTGTLDVAALGARLAEVVRRHEVLRTTFADDRRAGAGRRARAGRAPLPLVDLRGAAGGRARGGGGAAGRRPRRSGRSTSPAARCCGASCCASAAASTWLLLNLHHIVSDGWSMGVLVRELAALYAAFPRARPSPLPELPIQYADFAVWQRGWLPARCSRRSSATGGSGSPAPRAARAADRPAAARRADLPRRAPAVRAAGARLAHGAAARSAGATGATLFMALLAAFAALLRALLGPGRHRGRHRRSPTATAPRSRG